MNNCSMKTVAVVMGLCWIAGSAFGKTSPTAGKSGPTVAQPASAVPAVVSGTSCTLSVLGADKQGEAKLTYTWSSAGPAPVSFSTNGSNAAKTAVATFTAAGNYTMTAVIRNSKGLTVSSSVGVQVLSTPTVMVVAPASVEVLPLATVQFSAIAYDQFNSIITPPPVFTWTAEGISITADGLATADGTPGTTYSVQVSCGTVSASASLKINLPPLPAPVITPSGGTFSEPLTVSITPSACTPLADTPGWRTGVKYPALGIESVEALSRDGSAVSAMRGMTAAKSIYMFPAASMSPDSGPFPFYIWSLADLNGPANQFMVYQPSLFAGVTENTAWDGNNYDFYYRETGNRVFLLLEQWYRRAISLWSCAAGTYQYDTAEQMLTQFPLPSMESLAGTPLSMEFGTGKVRLLLGGSPLVSAETDSNGWVTYTGPSASGRVNAPLGDTRFWMTLAGGEKPGKREMVISDEPLVTTRFTYDGSPVTESSLEVTGPLTLTSDTTLKARCYSPAYSPSPETVAVFDSLIPEVPGESYVSPAYIEILHATLDGSPTVVSLSGPSGTTNGLALSDHLFTLRYPLSATGPTLVTLHRSGIPDLSTNILWREIDLAEYGRPDEMTIRLGESLLLTACAGQTNGEVVITITDESGALFAAYRSPITDNRSPIPVLFDQPGTFTVTATLDGISVGSMEVNVVYVNFDGPIACQVGYKREKGVEVFGPTNQVFFTAKDETILSVSVKEGTDYGVRLYLKPLARGTPVVQARLGSSTGPILAEQEIDEFTVDSSAALHVVVNGATGIANTELKMKPWIPDIDVNCAMFANYSTFAGGATEYSLNTSDFSAQNINGDPAVELVVDPVSGETQAIIRVDFEIPPDEGSYCFRAVFDQHSKYGTQVSQPVNCNGDPCWFTIDVLYIAEGDLNWHTLKTKAKNENRTVPNHPAGHFHTMLPVEDTKFKVSKINYANTFDCLTDTNFPDWNPDVALTADAKAKEKYSVNICKTTFSNVIIVVGVAFQIFADQPGAGGDRDPYEVLSWIPYSASYGHAFWRFIVSDPSILPIALQPFANVHMGYYPTRSVRPAPAGNPSCPGNLIKPDTSHLPDHEVDHTWKISLPNCINGLLYSKSLFDTPGEYDLNTNNCTDAAIKAGAAAGITIPDNQGTWPGGGGSNAGDLGEDLRNLQ